MSRMSEILLVAGLVILLCGPSVALSQTAVMQSGCARTMPQIDGQLENLWLTEAHHENITGLILKDSALQQGLGNTDLYVMNDGRYLYLALVMTTEPGFCGQLCHASPTGQRVTPQPPALAQDVTVVLTDLILHFEDDGERFRYDESGDEGAFGVMATWPDLWELMTSDQGSFQLVPHWSWRGTRGGPREPDEECGYGLVLYPPYVEIAARAEYGGGGASSPGSGRIVLELRIDLVESPLNLTAGECFRGLLITMSRVGVADGAEYESPSGVLDPAVWAAQNEVAAGMWPSYADLMSCVQEKQLPPIEESCDWYMPCFGEVCLNPCAAEEEQEEFVPEPGTVLLLGSGLMGLAGYASLRRRRR